MPAIPRPDDICPACGAATVFWCELDAPPLPTIFDGCSTCGKIWERETRAVPSAEMCDNCAWRPGSPEEKSGDLFHIYCATIMRSGIFYCHKGVPMDPGKAFEHKASADGKRIANAPVCAGWVQAKLKEKAEERAFMVPDDREGLL